MLAARLVPGSNLPVWPAPAFTALRLQVSTIPTGQQAFYEPAGMYLQRLQCAQLLQPHRAQLLQAAAQSHQGLDRRCAQCDGTAAIPELAQSVADLGCLLNLRHQELAAERGLCASASCQHQDVRAAGIMHPAESLSDGVEGINLSLQAPAFCLWCGA